MPRPKPRFRPTFDPATGSPRRSPISHVSGLTPGIAIDRPSIPTGGSASGTQSETIRRPGTQTRPRTRPATGAQADRPRLYKVILLNDDFTPRDFVVKVLRAVFRMSEAEAGGVMLTAHRRGACVVAVYTREVAEMKALEGCETGRSWGYPLAFTTERED